MTIMTPWPIQAAPTTASCSALVRTWPVSVTVWPLDAGEPADGLFRSDALAAEVHGASQGEIAVLRGRLNPFGTAASAASALFAAVVSMTSPVMESPSQNRRTENVGLTLAVLADAIHGR